ncbi:MAG: hypothetical protein M5U28_50835 [Sandaracinaceae bacterium]|nr:hypothetical protein [Sandaracinaceae bacterium]
MCSRDEGRESDAPPGPRSGSTRALSQQQEDASADRAVYARLLFEALSDLVDRMRPLQSGQAAAQ